MKNSVVNKQNLLKFVNDIKGGELMSLKNNSFRLVKKKKNKLPAIRP